MRSLIPVTHDSEDMASLVTVAGIVAVVALVISGLVGIVRASVGRAAIGGEVVVEDAEPLVGPGFVDSFNVLCRRPAATKIQASCGQLSYSAEIDSEATGTAYFGGPAVSTTTYGASRTAGEEIGGNVRYEYCVANEDAGVTLHVRSMCASEQ